MGNGRHAITFVQMGGKQRYGRRKRVARIVDREENNDWYVVHKDVRCFLLFSLDCGILNV